MIIESILIGVFALGLDFTFGDPKNKYHPTSWIGTLIAKLVPVVRHQNMIVEKIGGVFIILITTGIVLGLLFVLYWGISLYLGFVLYPSIAFFDTSLVTIIVFIATDAVLLKSTLAIRGMERHALAVVDSLDDENLDLARMNLSMIVKRDTRNLDKNHIISGVLESISENTVDGVTAPLFFYAIFGIPGAFVYRVVNTADSMIGYKNNIFRNIGWFTAKCDTILNYIPSRLTGCIMIVSAALLGYDWRSSYNIMIRDAKKTASCNAGYPMAALAGALGTKFEKINHYTLGCSDAELTKQHIRSAIAMMKLTSILFFIIVTLPIVVILGWLFHV